MTLTRRTFLAGAPSALAACSAEPVWAPDAAVQARRYVSGGPPTLTLFTVNNSGSDNGAHSALLVDGSQRVLFDPAGTFQANAVPERNDVLFGFSPAVERAYLSYHARTEYYVVIQTIAVSSATAEQALRLVQENGAVAKANCTRVTSALIKKLPGFGGLNRTWFPNNLSEDFGQIAGVTTTEYREQD